MTTTPGSPPERDNTDPFASLDAPQRDYFQRRRDRIVAQIQANRRGEYVVPTWVLALALVAMIIAVVLLLAS